MVLSVQELAYHANYRNVLQTHLLEEFGAGCICGVGLAAILGRHFSLVTHKRPCKWDKAVDTEDIQSIRSYWDVC